MVDGDRAVHPSADASGSSQAASAVVEHRVEVAAVSSSMVAEVAY